MRRILGDDPAIHLIAPQDYLPFVRLMLRSHIILADSGGIQEEAPSLGKPVLVMRDLTERREAAIGGMKTLVGTSSERIVAEVGRLLDDDSFYARMSLANNPYDEGNAATRIAGIVARYLDAPLR